MLSKTPSKNQKTFKKNCQSPQMKIIQVQSSLTQLLTMQKILARQIQQMDYDEPGQAIRNKISSLCLQTSTIKQDYKKLKKDITNELQLGFTDIKKVIQQGFCFLSDKINEKKSIQPTTITLENAMKKKVNKEQLQNFYDNIKKKCLMKQDVQESKTNQSSPIKMLTVDNCKQSQNQTQIRKNSEISQQSCFIKEKIIYQTHNYSNSTPFKAKRSPSLPKPLRRYPSSNSLSTKQEPIKSNDQTNKENNPKLSKGYTEYQNHQSSCSKLSTIRQLINASNKVQMIQKNIFNECVTQGLVKKNIVGINFTYQSGQGAIQKKQIEDNNLNEKQRTNMLLPSHTIIQHNRQNSQQKAPPRQRSTKKLKVFSRI